MRRYRGANPGSPLAPVRIVSPSSTEWIASREAEREMERFYNFSPNAAW